MRIIKSYKIFESNELVEVEDILVDIKDSGHDIHTTIHNFSDYDRMDVFINFSPSVYISEFKDSISHLLSKLESEDWHISSQWIIEDQENSLPWKPSAIFRLDLDSDKRIKRIELRFDKFK
jgi:hypothetical protein